MPQPATWPLPESLEHLDEAHSRLEPELASLVDDRTQAQRRRFVDQRHEPMAVDLGHEEVDRVGADVDGRTDRRSTMPAWRKGDAIDVSVPRGRSGQGRDEPAPLPAAAGERLMCC